MSEMSVHEVLVEARTRLTDGHLAKGTMDDHKGGYCAYGAVYGGRPPGNALYRGTVEWEAASVLHRLVVGTGDPAWYVVNFNNHPATTKVDVLMLLDHAIAATAPKPPEPDPEDFTVETRELELVA